MQQSVIEDVTRESQFDPGGESCETEMIHYLGMYHKYWVNKYKRLKNPAFDRYSSKILGLKRGKISSVRYFYSLLGKIIPKKSNLMICIVPSSDPGDKNPGIKRVAKAIAEKNGLIDGTEVLVRTKRIQKLADGGVRSRRVHYRSIEVRWGNARKTHKRSVFDGAGAIISEAMRARVTKYLEDLERLIRRIPKSEQVPAMDNVRVLLIDDVATSGNSLRACRELLLRNGAKRVYMLALGRTAAEG
ncbi:MAG: phosphoribosyltransferase [Oribacterium sp.]|nr:phosphoribosyltransferase [Oribacterium sp.]